MIGFIAVIKQFYDAIRRGLADPEFRALSGLVAILLTAGTIFYWREEGWSILDSLYFSVITLTTIGYGDMAPTSSASKVFTIVYVLIGLGVLVSFLSVVAGHAVDGRVERRSRKSSD